MGLSDRRIMEEREKGNIVIDPFNQRQLATSSYDVRLGPYFFREQHTTNPIYNVYDATQTREVWGEPQEAEIAKKVLKGTYKGIRSTDLVILIGPGETILGHTIEFIGGRNTITTMMKARSSWGRNFIEVCKCAGWGDVGYFNRWTMEITNNSRTKCVPLVVERRIAQIIFFEAGEILTKNYADEGKYQSDTDLEKLKADWHPDLMLPRLYKDSEAQLI